MKQAPLSSMSHGAGKRLQFADENDDLQLRLVHTAVEVVQYRRAPRWLCRSLTDADI
jgi:hypothetical protein